MPRRQLRTSSEAIGNPLATSGYLPDGVSMHSHAAAKGPKNVKLSQQFDVQRTDRGRHLSDDELLHEYHSRIEWLLCEIGLETSPTRLAKLSKQLEIKQRIVTELKGKSNE